MDDILIQSEAYAVGENERLLTRHPMPAKAHEDSTGVVIAMGAQDGFFTLDKAGQFLSWTLSNLKSRS